MPTICKQFRLGIFFDGTGNNKLNDRKHIADRKGQQHQAEEDKDSDIAYANDPSNIAKISELYENGKTIIGDELKQMQVSATICEIRTEMIYVEGVGTNVGEGDYATGLALGVDGAKRINQTIDKVEKLFTGTYSEDKYNCVIDVFGFSRGSAMARDFINTFNKRFGGDFKHYKFGFIGIYDTVGSFGVPGNDINFKPIDPSKHSEANVDLMAFESGTSRKGSMSRNNFEKNFEAYNFNLSAKSAQKIYHITAADEYRVNFPLTNIKGSGGFEVSCIGVHSDIGGGYSPTFTDKSTFYPAEGRFFKDEAAWRLRHLLSSNRGVDDPIAKANEFAKKKEQELGAGWKCTVGSISRSGITSANVLCTQERIVSNDLQNVTLNMMYTQALLAGAPLKAFIPPNVPADLQAYDEKANSGIVAAAGYEPRKPILDKYAHRSSYDSKDRLHHRDAEGLVDQVSNNMNYENNRSHRENYDNKPVYAVALT